jgi:serine/threonine protein kinase
MFKPKPNQKITIEHVDYYFDSHPIASEFVYGQEGRHGTVYRLRTLKDQCYALKIFHKFFRNIRINTIAALLNGLYSLPGMRAAQRRVLSATNAKSLIAEYPELEYAVLMPWLDGQTCLELFFSRKPLSFEECINLASQLSLILSTLEAQGLAHSDISASNVVLNLQTKGVSLVGLESFYGHNFPISLTPHRGTPGYVHPRMLFKKDEPWCLDGDRFAGAILMSELLTWFNEDVRESTYGESFFSLQDFEQPSNRKQVLLHLILRNISVDIADLYQQIWCARTLSECPPMSSWRNALCTLL